MTTSSPYNIPKPFRIAIIGSGNWGTAVAKLVAENCAEKPEIFEKQVNMWVFEEDVGGRKLTDIINTDHENVRYMPDVKLPENLVANPDIEKTVEGADLLIETSTLKPQPFCYWLLREILSTTMTQRAALLLHQLWH